MVQSIELFYNFIEAFLLTTFVFQYFEMKLGYNKIFIFMISIIANFTSISMVTIFKIPWLTTFVVAVLVLVGILHFFFTGSVLEHFLISFLITSLLAVTSIITLTFMSKLLGVGFSTLVNENSTMRFLTIMITKLLFVVCMIITISFRKKQKFLLTKAEYLIVFATFIISGIIVSIVRNIIYENERNYNAFLLLVICLLCLNIGQYYTLFFITQKNKSEQKVSLMNKQLEIQEQNIHNLEQNYAESSKLRHDIKNYILCALEMAENSEYEELTNYLRNLSGSKLNKKSTYVNTERKAIGAVVNSKLSLAESRGINVKCIIFDEMNNIEDIDAAILLSNLLDNAIEACEKNKGNSEIMLKIWTNAGYHCIDLSNTVESDILSSNPRLITSKKDKNLHGVGLQTVKDIVEKYEGIISFVQKNCFFHVCVSLIRD